MEQATIVQENKLVRIKQDPPYILMYPHLSGDVGIVRRTWKLKYIDTHLCEVFWQKANKSFKIEVNHVECVF